MLSVLVDFLEAMAAGNHTAIRRNHCIGIQELMEPAHDYVAHILADALAAALGEVHNPRIVVSWLLLAICNEPIQNEGRDASLLSAG